MAIGNKHIGYGAMIQNEVDYFGFIYGYEHLIYSRPPLQLPSLFKTITVSFILMLMLIISSGCVFSPSILLCGQWFMWP